MADQLNDWWEGLSSDERGDFLAYLRKVVALKSFSGPKAAKKKRLINDIIIPTLDAGGYMPQSHEFIGRLRNEWKMDPIGLFTYIKELFQHMTEDIPVAEAARLIRKSHRTMQRWAKTKPNFPAIKNSQGHWRFNRQTLIDYMV